MTQAGKALKPDKAAFLGTVTAKGSKSASALKRQFCLYMPFVKSEIQKLMSYRLNFFVFMAGGFLGTFVTYYLWKAIFHNSTQKVLAGFSLRDIIIYVFISEITGRLIFSNVDYTISEEVKDGSIAMNLIKPINYHMRLFAQAIGGTLHQFATVAFPLWIGLVIIRFIVAGELPPDIRTFLLYVFSTILSFIILFLFNFCFGMLAFYTTNTWGLRMAKGATITFFNGQLIPLAFFPLWVQKCLYFVPFGSMNYTPVMIYLKKITDVQALKAVGIQFIWIIILLMLSKWVWHKTVKRLTILGG